MDSAKRFTRSVHAAVFTSLMVALGTLLVPAEAYAVCGDNIIDCPDENCDDGNLIDGDGCNSLCRNEFGYVCQNPTDPLTVGTPISRWKLDERGVSTTAVDDIGGVNGTYSLSYLNGPGALRKITWNAPYFNLEPNSEFVEIPHDPIYELDRGAISLWFNAQSIPAVGDGYMGLVAKDHTGWAEGGHIQLYILEGGTLRARLQESNGGLLENGASCTAAAECAGGACTLNASSVLTCSGDAASHIIDGPVVAAETWYHVILTWGPGGFNMYLDGNATPVANDPYTGGLWTSSGGLGNTQPWVLGASTGTATGGTTTPKTAFFSGRIDNVIIYGDQLTGTQVANFHTYLTCNEVAGPGSCTSVMTAQPTCGDGILDSEFEQCDDGNTVAGDGCDEFCIDERCGDGIINNNTGTPETCDDGNRKDSDGCDTDCQVEPTHTCDGLSPTSCNPIATCGDGVVEGTEVCDDGMMMTTCGDNCDRFRMCGDGVVDTTMGETCDDGLVRCTLDTDCPVGATCSVDGDGDGTNDLCTPLAGDGCDANCQVEPGWVCSAGTATGWREATLPSLCKTVCGDGIVQGTEECDDPAILCTAGCPVGSACSVDGDGDGVAELCSPVSNDGCDSRCVVETCGDGFIQPGEQCDDGNVANGDGCRSNCNVEAGFVCPLDGGGGPGPGPCIPENTCNPLAQTIYTANGSHNHVYTNACPFNPTLDTNGDGVKDCGPDGQTVMVYQNVPAFDVTPGLTKFRLDAINTSATEVFATVEVAAALSNGSQEPDASGFTTIATNVSGGFGDTQYNNFDLAFEADTAWSFAGGGLIVRITEISGSLDVKQGSYSTLVLSSENKRVGAWKDYDGAFPWDESYTNHNGQAVIDMRIQDGEFVCRFGQGEYCDAGISACRPSRADYPQTVSWCGTTGGSANDCETLNNWNTSTTYTTDATTNQTCVTVSLRKTTYDSCVGDKDSSTCSPTTTTVDSWTKFCDNCDDEKLWTGNTFSTTTGCNHFQYADTDSRAYTTCFTGPSGQANVGRCRTGKSYYRSPGADCREQGFGIEEICGRDTSVGPYYHADEDCNGTYNDPEITVPLCDDGNILTADSCFSYYGYCRYIPLCENTDISCGNQAPCVSCTAQNGWYPVEPANTRDCCDTGQSCTCQELESRTYFCDSAGPGQPGACSYTLDPVSTIWETVAGSCSTCDDANTCTDDSCDVVSGLCSNVENGFSGTCYNGPAGTMNIGVCREGTETCGGTLLGACTDVTPGTETCDNRDEDCNGLIDDGLADDFCTDPAQGCWSGQCDENCLSDAECAAGEVCVFELGRTPGRCTDDPDDQCLDVNCPPGKTCWEGSCTSDNCGANVDCEPGSKCYTNSGRCAFEEEDKCRGVQCPAGKSCNTKGFCRTDCPNGVIDCDAAIEECRGGFCEPIDDPCSTTDCAADEVCNEGSCFPQCGVNADCLDPADVCYDATYCAPPDNPCDTIVCPDNESCVGGTCYPDCTLTTECDPADACFDAARCAVDNCDGILCPQDEACQGGVCYLTCTEDIDCAAISTSHQCWGGFCKISPCDGVQCADGQTCVNGGCYYSCVDDADCSMYGPDHACFDGYCAVDPCDGRLCPINQSCWQGTCYDDCTAGDPTCATMTDGCWGDFRCEDPTGPCAGVQCATSDVCYQGACYEDCSTTMTCTDPSHVCYNSLYCAPADDACTDVQCITGDTCYGGSCYQTCMDETNCDDPAHLCYDGRCATTACEGVNCATGEQCFEGICYQTCTDSLDCTDPTHQCYNNLCQDPCTAANCLDGETCYLGTCYEDCNDVDDFCSNPEHICYDGRCVDGDNPYCDGVNCPMGENCYRGACYPECDDQADCDPESVCYKDVCVPKNCGSTFCEDAEVCYNGICYPSCEDPPHICEDPSHICYDDSRCAATACEAQAEGVIADYNSDHVWRTATRRLHGEQYSIPWVWPRPYTSPGDDFESWADVSNGGNASSDNDALYAKGAARVVIYHDDTDSNSYVIWLIHGSKDASQGDAEAVYSVRVRGSTSPSAVLMDDNDGEAFFTTPDESGWRHAQVAVTTEGAETGGVAIGSFQAGDPSWEIKIAASFSGDIDRWELMNGETGRVELELFQGEMFTIDNANLPDSRQLMPSFGTACDLDVPGICSKGTITDCENWQPVCDQTVLPWAYEACDGVDNTCNGFVDGDDSSLKFQTVEFAKWDLESSPNPAYWSVWPSYDSADNVVDLLRYEPESDDRLGSTNMVGPTGDDIQDPGRIYVVMHRNTVTGQFSMPILVGKKTDNDGEIDDYEDQDTLTPTIGASDGVTQIEDGFMCWYDDRKPGNTNDEILRRFRPVADEMTWFWNIEENNDELESDTVVFRPMFTEPHTGNPSTYWLDWAYEDVDEDWDRSWRRYSPSISDLRINAYEELFFRMKANDPDNSYCISDSRTENGCPLGTYICAENRVECSPPDDTFCEESCFDLDGDGYIRYDPAYCPDGTDCDDFDSETYPGANEVCDGRDNDCDDLIDVQSEFTDPATNVTTNNCPNGEASCGPTDCGFLPVCSCPAGVVEYPGDPEDTCFCAESLEY